MKRPSEPTTMELNFKSVADRTCQFWRTFRHVSEVTRMNDGVRVVVDIEQARRVIDREPMGIDALRTAVIAHLSRNTR